MSYLVYVRGLKGPMPQLWHEDKTKGTGEFQNDPVGHPGSRLLSFRELDKHHSTLSLDALVMRFPFVEGQVVLLSSTRNTTTSMPMNEAPDLHTSLRSANRARQAVWDKGDRLSLSYRGNELGGEVGEALNFIKKLERERMGLVGSRGSIQDLSEELGDVVICADLVAMARGIDLDLHLVSPFSAPGLSLTALGCQMLSFAGQVGDIITEVELTSVSQPWHNEHLVKALEGLVSVAARIAVDVGIVLQNCTATKFNKTSEKYGLSTRLRVSDHQAATLVPDADADHQDDDSS